MSKLLTAGSINTDLVVRVRRAPEAGETVTGEDFAIFGGGKGANQTVAAARSGADVAILGAIGADDFGRQRLADLEAEGIDTTGVARIAEAPSGVALITVEEGGENRIAYVPGATMRITHEHVTETFARIVPQTILTTLELPADALEELVSIGRRVGAPIIVNATPEPASHAAIAAQADVLIVNETEARELIGWGEHQSDWEAAAVRLAALGPSNVIITLGAAGALVLSESGVKLIPSPAVTVVDTTGAGDAFCGAFAAKLAAGVTIEAAALAGVIAGALAVTKAGAQPSQPTLAEIDAMRNRLSAS
ncbi:MAG: ribokinase [Thermomicrobiales bacterium]|nr:ribokinase [Thermomicrobiales bacterium]